MPGGRPTKLTPEVQERICEALSVGCSRKDAAACALVGYEALLRWYQRGETARRGIFREFYKAVVVAEAKPRERAYKSIAKAADDGDWRAGESYLKHRDHENFRQRQELTGPNGGPIQTSVQYNLAKLSDEEFEDVLVKLRKAAG